MDHVRLMLWCTTCVTGVQLPAFRAAADGLFAEQGIDVEFVAASPTPDYTLRGFSERPRAVARGDAEFAVTSVAYTLAAQTNAAGELPARFAAVLHRRNPVVGIVLEHSDILDVADLPGRRTANWALTWFVREYEAALAVRGLAPPVLVPVSDTSYGAEALASGAVDVVPTWADTLPIVRTRVGRPVRAISLDVDVYASGLLAADRVPLDVVRRMRDALVEGFERQQQDPHLGIEMFRRSFPNVSPEDVQTNWSLFNRSALGEEPLGSMSDRGWRDTIAYMTQTHGLCATPPERLYRSELAADEDS